MKTVINEGLSIEEAFKALNENDQVNSEQNSAIKEDVLNERYDEESITSRTQETPVKYNCRDYQHNSHGLTLGPNDITDRKEVVRLFKSGVSIIYKKDGYHLVSNPITSMYSLRKLLDENAWGKLVIFTATKKDDNGTPTELVARVTTYDNLMC